METEHIPEGTVEEKFQYLLATIRKYQPDLSEDILTKAFLLAADAHKTQRRVSGELYIVHPLSLIHISEPTRQDRPSRMPSSA